MWRRAQRLSDRVRSVHFPMAIDPDSEKAMCHEEMPRLKASIVKGAAPKITPAGEARWSVKDLP